MAAEKPLAGASAVRKPRSAERARRGPAPVSGPRRPSPTTSLGGPSSPAPPRPGLGRVLAVLARVGPAVVWAGLIFALSSQSEPPMPTAFFFGLILPGDGPVELYLALEHLARKVGHFGEYAILAVLVHHALGLARGWSADQRYAVAWLLTILYAASDELHQAFVPGRGAVITDVIIDSCGALAALALHRLLARRWHARRAGQRSNRTAGFNT